MRSAILGGVLGLILAVVASFFQPNVKIKAVQAPEITKMVTYTTEPTETASASYTEATGGYFETEAEPVQETIAEPQRAYFDCKLSTEVQDYLFTVCESYNVNPALIVAMIEHESDFRDWVIGDSGESYGLMQIKVKYQSERMKRLGCTDLLDPYECILTGVDIVAERFEHFDDVVWVLMAYNGGVSYANRCYLEQGKVSNYAKEILERTEYYSAMLEVE